MLCSIVAFLFAMNWKLTLFVLIPVVLYKKLIAKTSKAQVHLCSEIQICLFLGISTPAIRGIIASL